MIKSIWVFCILVFSVSSFGGESKISPASSSKLFSNLNFAISIDYSSRALHKLQKSNEKVKVWIIIDQFGKQYMEEEAVASAEIIINPGEKAVFHGIPLEESNYRYKANKRYILTISVISARKIYENNILNCYSRSGIDHDIHTIQNKTVQFTCKLIR